MTDSELTIFALRRALAVSIATHAAHARCSADDVKASLIEALDLYVTQNPSASQDHQAAIEAATAEIRRAGEW